MEGEGTAVARSRLFKVALMQLSDLPQICVGLFAVEIMYV